MKKVIYLATITAFMFASCTNSEKQADATTTTTQAEESTSTAPENETNDAVVTLSAGDDMKFDLAEIKVKEGKTVKLTLTHTGKMAKTVMGHNFVLLAKGVVLADFAGKAIAATTTEYIPAESKKDIIAHTKLIGGGESDTIEFIAPAKGAYDFLCSFPGHSALMKGKLVVE